MENSVIGVLIGELVSFDCKREFQAHFVTQFYKCFAMTILTVKHMALNE